MIQQLLILSLSSREWACSLREDKEVKCENCGGFRQTAIRNIFVSHRGKNLHIADIRSRPSVTVNKSNFATDDNCHGWVSSCIPKWYGVKNKYWLWCVSGSDWHCLTWDSYRAAAGRESWRRPWSCPICEMLMDLCNAKGILKLPWPAVNMGLFFSPPGWDVRVLG